MNRLWAMGKKTKKKDELGSIILCERKGIKWEQNLWQFYRIASMCLVTLHVCLPSQWSSALTQTFYSILFTSLHLMKHTFNIMQPPKPIQQQSCGRASQTHETTRETNETCSKIIIIIEWYLNAAVCVLLHSLHCIALRTRMELNCELRENSCLQLSRTYRIVFLIRTQDKVKTIYQANVTIEFTKADSITESHSTSRAWQTTQSREVRRYELEFLANIICSSERKRPNVRRNTTHKHSDIDRSWFYKLQDNINRLTGRCLRDIFIFETDSIAIRVLDECFLGSIFLLLLKTKMERS